MTETAGMKEAEFLNTFASGRSKLEFLMDGNEIKISASILCANWMHLEEDLRILEKEHIDYIHYDIMDGFFAPDYCLGFNIINEIRKHTNIKSDYHLMVEEPARMFGNIEPEEGAILSIHYEACKNLHRDLVKIKKMGFRSGLVLNPGTPLNSIEYVIEEVDVITVMTVNPGYKGQKLVPQTIKKIASLYDMREEDEFDFEICVDGNVNEENIPKMVSAGADILVGGSSGLFVRGKTLQESIATMHECIEKGTSSREVYKYAS